MENPNLTLFPIHVICTVIQRGEWPSGPASSICLTAVKHGCVRTEIGWATFQMNDQNSSLRRSCGRDVKLGVPECGMYGRPNLAEKLGMTAYLQ